MKHARILFLLIAFLTMNSVNAQKQEIKSIDSIINLFVKSGCFNGEAFISVDNKPFYDRVVGYRDIRTKEKLLPNSIFNLGSISKPFTAIAVLQLQEKNLLDIDDKVSKYIPEFPIDGICIKHLLSHTSGLLTSIDQIDGIDLSNTVTNDSIVGLLVKYRVKPIFEPGSEWGYSNLGYDLLAVLVERITKMKFADYMQKNIFLPAGMTRTFISNSRTVKDWLPGNVSETDLMVPHMFDNITSCNVVPIDSVPWVSGAKDYFIGSANVYSTVYDLAKFDRAMRENSILGHKLQELAYTPYVLNNGDTAKDMRAAIPSYYGLGWFISIDKSRGRILWHKGRWFGSVSVFLRNPEKRQTVTFTDNFDYRSVDLKGIAALKIVNHQHYRNPVLMSLVQKFGCGIYSRGFDAALADFKSRKEQERQNYYISEDEMADLGNKLEADHRMDDAIAVLTYCKELFPKSSAIFSTYADLMLKTKNPAKSVENYRQAVILFSTDAAEQESLLNGTGYVLLVANRLDDAELVLKLNTELFPESCNTYDSYASALEKNNKINLAIEIEEKAVALATDQNDKLLEILKENLKKLKSEIPGR
ncbi:MAG: beta-lactamase family protein [Bacteroidetes bacterium]|nr:beta-lactamase family protein [Bacteroidota bacterium]